MVLTVESQGPPVVPAPAFWGALSPGVRLGPPEFHQPQVILLKQWDSQGWLHGGPRATFTLHSAFKDPSSPEEGEDRVSCEARGGGTRRGAGDRREWMEKAWI